MSKPLNLLPVSHVFAGLHEIKPFLLGPHRDDPKNGKRHELFWIETGELGLDSQPIRSDHQTLESYSRLPSIEVHIKGQPCQIHQAVCERIPGGEVHEMRSDDGVRIWTVLPNYNA